MTGLLRPTKGMVAARMECGREGFDMLNLSLDWWTGEGYRVELDAISRTYTLAGLAPEDKVLGRAH